MKKQESDCISRRAVLEKIKEVCFSKEWARFRADYGSNGQRDLLIDYIEQLPHVEPQPRKGYWIRWYEEEEMNKIVATAYYPIFFTPKITMQHDILVYIPDFDIYTEGDSIDDAIEMAKDAIVNTLSETKKFVKPSGIVQAYQKAIEDADDICDFFKDGILTFVKVDVSDYIDRKIVTEDDK